MAAGAGRNSAVRFALIACAVAAAVGIGLRSWNRPGSDPSIGSVVEIRPVDSKYGARWSAIVRLADGRLVRAGAAG